MNNWDESVTITGITDEKLTSLRIEYKSEPKQKTRASLCTNNLFCKFLCSLSVAHQCLMFCIGSKDQ